MPRYESNVEIRCQYEAPFDVAYTNNGMVEVVRYTDWKKSQRVIWMARAEAAFWARCGNDFDQSDIKHQYHILTEKWNWAARKCLAKSKEFE